MTTMECYYREPDIFVRTVPVFLPEKIQRKLINLRFTKQKKMYCNTAKYYKSAWEDNAKNIICL